MKYIATVDGQEYTIEIIGPNQILVDGEPATVDFQRIGGLSLYSLILNNLSHEVVVEDEGRGAWRAMLGGELFEVRVEDERTRRLARATRRATVASGELAIKAPIPGLVVKVPVAPGDPVVAGQGVVILEAMKMENELTAPRNGTVHEVRVSAGQAVEQGQILLIIV